jgi:predicted DNA-binding transcriptional regulator AlpA
MSEVANKSFLTSAQVRARYGNVSFMWIERRLADDSAFPKPTKMGRLRFWKLADLEAWERTQAAKTKKSTAAA